MSRLDEMQRDANVPKSENMVQHAFNQYNKARDLMDSIKLTPRLYRTVHQARTEYKAARAAIQEKEKETPVVTAQDIKDEMYR